MHWLQDLYYYTGKTQAEFSKDTGISQSSLSTIISSGTTIDKVSVSILRRISKAYSIPIDAILNRWGA